MKISTEPEPLRFLRLKSVLQLTGLKKSTLYALMKQGLFPHQHKLASRAVAWLAHEVSAWIQKRSNFAVAA